MLSLIKRAPCPLLRHQRWAVTNVGVAATERRTTRRLQLRTAPSTVLTVPGSQFPAGNHFSLGRTFPHGDNHLAVPSLHPFPGHPGTSKSLICIAFPDSHPSLSKERGGALGTLPPFHQRGTAPEHLSGLTTGVCLLCRQSAKTTKADLCHGPPTMRASQAGATSHRRL